jgi:hypothetical protein
LPWAALLDALGEARFREIQAALRQAGTPEEDRDAFLLDGAAGRLLRDVMPHDAPAETVNAYGTLLHMLFVAWSRGWPVARADGARLVQALRQPARPVQSPEGDPAPVCYVQLPERMVWAAPLAGAPHEPIDGIFVARSAPVVRTMAILGFREAREGFTTVEATARLPLPLPEPRPDGTPAFASLLPAGERAGLFSVADEAELVALAMLALDARSD